jgi:HSP20 family protein
LEDKVASTPGALMAVDPEFAIDGKMQGDAALSKRVLDRVFPDSRLTADTSLLIMPILDPGNAYNLLRVAAGGGISVGPILLGAAQPAHILTQTATVRGLLNMVGSFPPIHIFQRGDDFVAIVELPGVDKNGLEIEAKETAIRISGRKTITYNAGASVHRRERSSGSFDRTIQVPVQIDPEAVTAELQKGMLMLLIPRTESDKPRTIKIK